LLAQGKHLEMKRSPAPQEVDQGGEQRNKYRFHTGNATWAPTEKSTKSMCIEFLVGTASGNASQLALAGGIASCPGSVVTPKSEAETCQIAGMLPDFSHPLRPTGVAPMSEAPRQDRGIKERVGTELKSYAVISGYLLVCFSVILFYEAAFVPEKDAGLVSHGMALGKALIIGKFVLIGNALNVGSRMYAPSLLHRIAWKSVGLLLVLIVLTVIEEVIVGVVHGKTAGAALSEFFDKPLVQLAAPILMMLLVLIPLTATCELNRALGEGRLKALFLGRIEEASSAASAP
jgi:hypothetical protein